LEDWCKSITVEGRVESVEIRGFFPDFKGEVNPRTIDPWLIRRVGDTFNWGLEPSPNPATCAGIFRSSPPAQNR